MTQLVAGLLVASTMVTLLHWLRVHDRRLLPLMGLFVMFAAAESLEWWHYWRSAFQMVGIACGLVLLPMTRGRHTDGAPRA